MRLLLAAAALGVLVGCTFGVKTCSSSEDCSGGGQCVQGVCTIPSSGGGMGGGGEEDAGEEDGGVDAGTGGGAGGGTGGGAGGGVGGGLGGGIGGGGGAFDAGELVGIVFLTPPRVVRAGDCSEEIQVGVFVDGGTGTLTLVSANEEVSFHADSNCESNHGLEFPIPASNVVSLYFKSSVVSSVLVSAALSVDDPGTAQVQRVIAGRPAMLAFGSPVSARVGQCSSTRVIQVRDTFGNVTSLLTALDVALTSNSSTTQFFAGNDTTCSTPLSPAAVSLPAGASNGSFRFRDTMPGMPVFGAMGAGAEAPAPASQEQEIF